MDQDALIKKVQSKFDRYSKNMSPRIQSKICNQRGILYPDIKNATLEPTSTIDNQHRFVVKRYVMKSTDNQMQLYSTVHVQVPVPYRYLINQHDQRINPHSNILEAIKLKPSWRSVI